MRRILTLLTILLVVLCPANAKGENCQHDGLPNAAAEISYKDVEAGHVLVYTKTGECSICGREAVIQAEGGLTGHIFCMAESIHFTQDGMHLWVFICLDCKHVAVVEEPCAGGDWCLIYSAQTGVRAPVQEGESLEAWRQENTTEDYVSRWLAQQNKE